MLDNICLDNGEKLQVEYKKYKNENLAVLLTDNDGLPYAKLSVNTDEVLEEDEFILNHDLYLNAQLIKSVLNSGLFSYAGRKVNYEYYRNIPVLKVVRK